MGCTVLPQKCVKCATQKRQLYELLGRNRDIFAKVMSELGETHLHYHTSHTKDEKPVSCQP